MCLFEEWMIGWHCARRSLHAIARAQRNDQRRSGFLPGAICSTATNETARLPQYVTHNLLQAIEREWLGQIVIHTLLTRAFFQFRRGIGCDQHHARIR